jgi:hypothetical protein
LPIAQSDLGLAMLTVFKYGCASQTDLELLTTAIIRITRRLNAVQPFVLTEHTQKSKDF